MQNICDVSLHVMDHFIMDDRSYFWFLKCASNKTNKMCLVYAREILILVRRNCWASFAQSTDKRPKNDGKTQQTRFTFWLNLLNREPWHILTGLRLFAWTLIRALCLLNFWIIQNMKSAVRLYINFQLNPKYVLVILTVISCRYLLIAEKP